MPGRSSQLGLVLNCLLVYGVGVGFCVLARVAAIPNGPASASGAPLAPPAAADGAGEASPTAPRVVRDESARRRPHVEAHIGVSRYTLQARLKRRRVFADVVDDHDFVRLGEPRRGEWLYHFREPGQSLHEYLSTVGNRRTALRQTLHLVPFTNLGDGEALLEAIREHTERYFGVATKVLPPRHASARWFDLQRRQYDADRVARELARQVPPTSLGVLGLMGADMYGLGLDYIFGLGLLRDRAGVYSLHRYRTPDKKQMLRRALKVATHELGHMLGLRHCVFYRCLMNGSNSVEEMDRQPLHACPVCVTKLRWNLGFDARERARSLAAFYERHGLDEEAAFLRKLLLRSEAVASR